MRRPAALALSALLALSACGTAESDDPPPVPDGWAVLDEGTELYVELGHIRWELERECMAGKGFDVHPRQNEQRLADWRPVDREAPILAPSVEEARQVGLGMDPVKPAPSPEPDDPFNAESGKYRDDYLNAYYGEAEAGEYGAESCVATVHRDMFDEAPTTGAWQPIPVPDAIDWTARREMYYAIPAIVTASAAWRACLKGKGRKGFETIEEARTHYYTITGEDDRQDFAVDVATCVDASGWREVHTGSWRIAVDRLVTEQLPQIRAWSAELAQILDDAEDLLPA
ncbi:hypothetical protein [Phytomonospora endophytica]|uniref:Secreted protein n=1 Tax=Phytomonospora endophytica TaxID=714109 RepID=A0A841G3S6_9ACTN|nr:hypothetical protein [Phytomonospora endophytica]MBB6039359.1 hypothetical protein [Phytomonospora endophytica]GIG69700.1 hypothetical protein Pen01_59950 [Phytomonospora endophytica]